MCTTTPEGQLERLRTTFDLVNWGWTSTKICSFQVKNVRLIVSRPKIARRSSLRWAQHKSQLFTKVNSSQKSNIHKSQLLTKVNSTDGPILQVSLREAGPSSDQMST